MEAVRNGEERAGMGAFSLSKTPAASMNGSLLVLRAARLRPVAPRVRVRVGDFKSSPASLEGDATVRDVVLLQS